MGAFYKFHGECWLPNDTMTGWTEYQYYPTQPKDWQLCSDLHRLAIRRGMEKISTFTELKKEEQIKYLEECIYSCWLETISAHTYLSWWLEKHPRISLWDMLDEFFAKED